MTAVAASHGADQLGDAEALTDGFSAGLLGAGAIALVGALAVAAFMRAPKGTGDDAPVESAQLTA